MGNALGVLRTGYPIRSGRARGGLGPNSIAGLVGWWKADAGTFQDSGLVTPAAADGDLTGGWVDQSGNSQTLTAAGAARPTLKLAIQNGRSVLRFAGAHRLDSALFALNQPVTVCLAGTNTVGGNNAFADAVDVNITRVVDRVADTTLRLYTGTVFDTTVTTLTAWNALVAVFNGASSVLNFNGAETTGNAGAGNGQGVRVGAQGGAPSNFLTGDIGEVIVYSAALSPTDRAFIQAYLKSRWNTP